MKIFIFILGLIISILFLFSRNQSRKLTMFLGFVFVLQVGWVFYHYTGIFIYDFPILTLIFFGIFSNKKFKWYFRGLSLPALLFFFWSLLTASVAPIPGWTIAEASKILRGYLAFLAIANHIQTKKDVDYFLYSLFAGILFESFIGIWQWRVGPVGLWFLNENYNAWRATGTYYVPHFLANYLIMFLPIVLRLFIFYRAPSQRLTFFYGIVSAFGVLALFATYARGAWLGFAVGMGIMFLFGLYKMKFMPRIKWAFGIASIGGIIFFAQFLSAILAQFGDDRQHSIDARYKQYDMAKRIIAGLPLMGTGLGNYSKVSPRFLTSYEWATNDTGARTYMVHNSYLYYTAETGLVGGFFMLLGIVFLFRMGFRGLKSRSAYFANLTIGILCGDIAIAIAFLWGPDIHLEQFQVQFGMMTGLLVAIQRVESNYMKQVKQRALQKAGS